jgi:hypothetical protein
MGTSPGWALAFSASHAAAPPSSVMMQGHLNLKTPQMPAFESRIPAPLASPSQAPVINGPMSQPAFRGCLG